MDAKLGLKLKLEQRRQRLTTGRRRVMTQNHPATLARCSRLAGHGPERFLTPLTLTTTLASFLSLSSPDRWKHRSIRGLPGGCRATRSGSPEPVRVPPAITHPQASLPDAVLRTRLLLWLLSEAGAFSLRVLRDVAPAAPPGLLGTRP